MFLKGFKYRLYPNKEQRVLLDKHFGCVMFVYNHILELKNKQDFTKNKTASCLDLVSVLPDLKKQYPWLAEVNSQSLQMAIVNLDTAFNKFYSKKERCQLPKLKSRYATRFSFSVPQNYKIEDGKLYLPKFKKSGVTIKQHREIEGKQRSLTISKTNTGKYYASILSEIEGDPVQPKKNTEVDYTCLGRLKRRIRIHQKKLDNKQIGSNNRKKLVLSLAKMREKLANRIKGLEANKYTVETTEI